MLFTILFLSVISLLLSSSHGFSIVTKGRSLISRRYLSLPSVELTSSFIAAAAEVKPDDYVYGAVSAPDWALPLGAVLVILTAGIPILLKPGEEALDQQRENESITNNKFNKKKNKDL